MRKKRNVFVWAITILTLLIVVSLFFPFLSGVREVGRAVTSPLQGVLLSATVELKNRVEVFQSAEEVRNELEKLRGIEKRLQVALTEKEELKKENTALKEALGVDLHQEKEPIFAKVTGRELGKDRVIIHHTEKVSEGSLVMTPEGQLVGVIDSPGERSSSVRLLTSKESSFEVAIQSKNDPIGVLRGTGERELLLDLLPKDKDIKRGDRVVSLAGEKVPIDGVFIGRVAELKESDVEAFNTAKVWQGIDHRRLTYVFVAKK